MGSSKFKHVLTINLQFEGLGDNKLLLRSMYLPLQNIP
jgi:hypothetical protein